MNFAGKQPECENGQLLENVNIAQPKPHTKICEGITGLTFKSCNLTNCDVPEDAVVVDCLQIQRDFCVHLHPTMDLPDEPLDCRHVKDIIEVEGTIIGYVREDLDG
jgi:hypothetical protein